VNAVLGATPSVTWYLARSTGAVSLLLLTVTLVLGVTDVQRLSSRRWPRFVLDSLHRNVALLAVCFLAIHILMAVVDSFTKIRLWDAVVPFVGSYRPFWLGLGALAFDLMLAVTVTSMLRRWVGFASWRAVHWLSYASWPVALLHGLGTGSDTKSAWMLGLTLACFAAVLAAVSSRVAGVWRANRELGRLTLGATGAFTLFLVLWLPAGPLGSEWARRSGTPGSLLKHAGRRAGPPGGRRAERR
jgi:sulfoxide reductase heme-binding subunit YedZ